MTSFLFIARHEDRRTARYIVDCYAGSTPGRRSFVGRLMLHEAAWESLSQGLLESSIAVTIDSGLPAVLLPLIDALEPQMIDVPVRDQVL